ncbi:MAG: hypothetical protein HRT44_12930 [Bdellovibrionales bacterium]|nr:hypothetical protein [Bdellovibrionales bacterium]NQZ20141.1 hypothetical protein [Bdellovibrionales bacterium]
MKLIFVLIHVLIYNLTWAADWQALISAQNHHQLVEADTKNRKLERDSENCRLEKEKGLFPIHCFRVKEMQIEAPINTKVFKAQLRELNRLCIIRINKIHKLELIEDLLRSPFINSECRNRLRVHKSDLEYSEI